MLVGLSTRHSLFNPHRGEGYRALTQPSGVSGVMFLGRGPVPTEPQQRSGPDPESPMAVDRCQDFVAAGAGEVPGMTAMG